MHKIRLLIEYDGTHYSGWQIQPQHPTIQQVFRTILSKILNTTTHVTASGRTDAGVHALGQVATFRTERTIDLHTLQRALNAMLPPDISVLHVDEVPQDFHVVKDAIGKLYRYKIVNSGARPALRRNHIWHLRAPLDFTSMQDAANHLIGTHDFTSFQATGSDIKTTIRTLSRLEIMDQLNSDEYWIEAYANGFLKHMVRNIVGTLVDVGRGKTESGQLPSILEAQDRRLAGRAAPPGGLYLVKVDYPKT